MDGFILVANARCGTRYDNTAGLLYIAHRHTEVLGFHDHDGASAAWGVVEGVGDLDCQALLKLRSAGV